MVVPFVILLGGDAFLPLRVVVLSLSLALGWCCPSGGAAVRTFFESNVMKSKNGITFSQNQIKLK